MMTKQQSDFMLNLFERSFRDRVAEGRPTGQTEDYDRGFNWALTLAYGEVRRLVSVLQDDSKD